MSKRLDILQSIGLDRSTVSAMVSSPVANTAPDKRDGIISELRRKNHSMNKRNRNLQIRLNSSRKNGPSSPGTTSALAYAVPMVEAAMRYLRKFESFDGNIYSHAHITGKTRGCQSLADTRRAMAWALHTLLLEDAAAAPTTIDAWLGAQFGGRDRSTITYARESHADLPSEDSQRVWARGLLNHLQIQHRSHTSDYQI